ncbi:RICIN domain-containing protein [Promicromonospora sp. Populi]|uniref:RICIN domain-containing protein n=1 Tax=Promicromonospora sp. Populi TaxID=3239420 RepID=UPI0034E263FC
MSRTTRTGSIRTSLAALSVLAVGVVGIGLAAGPAAAAPTSAHVWVTTADGSRRLTDGGELAFNSTPQATNIQVNPAQVLQRFTGAGASVTEASAALINDLPAATRNSMLQSLFSRSGDGIGLNYLRQPLGSTDFNSGGFYTYEDTQGQFSIARDQQEILPVLQQARAINPGIRFMGSPWSPPAWMKTSNSLNGGSLRTDMYDEYATYLVRTIQAYAAQGVTLSDLTVQNEPLFATSYPSMSMSAAQQAAFFRVLDPALTSAGLGTQIFAYDHNWDQPGYPIEVFNGTAGISRIVGAAFHCYGGSPEAQAQVINAGKRVYFTECSGTDSANAASTFGDTLIWHAENLVVRNMRNGGETVINWNLALNQNGGPHQGHCTTRCNGVVEINGSTVTRNAEFYVLGQLSKFVDAGARRIGSTSEGSGGLQNVVFQNPNGTRVAYVVNASSGSRTFSITDEGRSVTHTLPGRAVATYTWDPQTTTTPPTDPDPAAWYQVTSSVSSKCLDGAGWGTTDGTGVQQWTCGPTTQANQRWQFTPTTDGYYRVTNQHAARVWDVAGGPGAVGSGAAIHLWSYVGGTNQQWRPTTTAGGAFTFTARHSNLCLTLGAATGTDGTGFTQQPCTGAAAQTFRLTRAG